MTIDQESQRSRAALHIFLACIVAAAFVGFLIGTRSIEPPGPEPVTSAVLSEDAVPSQSYLELRNRRVGKTAKTHNDYALLRKELPSVQDPVVQTAEQKDDARNARAERRAFEGAPPVIPHTVDEQNPGGCVSCHELGMRVAGRTAPPVSHPSYGQCTQCHVPGVRRPWDQSDPPANAFVGLGPSGPGTRAWEGAPPTMPHGEKMREKCSSCHGVAGRQGIRTTHPARQNCPQCHAPVADEVPWERVR